MSAGELEKKLGFSVLEVSILHQKIDELESSEPEVRLLPIHFSFSILQYNAKIQTFKKKKKQKTKNKKQKTKNKTYSKKDPNLSNQKR